MSLFAVAGHQQIQLCTYNFSNIDFENINISFNFGDVLFNLEAQSIKSRHYNSVNEQEKSIRKLSADVASDPHKCFW